MAKQICHQVRDINTTVIEHDSIEAKAISLTKVVNTCAMRNFTKAKEQACWGDGHGRGTGMAEGTGAGMAGETGDGSGYGRGDGSGYGRVGDWGDGGKCFSKGDGKKRLIECGPSPCNSISLHFWRKISLKVADPECYIENLLDVERT